MFAYCKCNPENNIDTFGYSAKPNNMMYNIMIMDGIGITFIDPCIHSRIGGSGECTFSEPKTEIACSISKDGISGCLDLELSHGEILEKDVELSVSVLKAEGEMTISPSAFSGSAGVYVAESKWTLNIFRLFDNKIKLSLTSNLGFGGSFKSTETGVSIGATCGLGFMFSVDYSILSLFSFSGR